MHSEICRLGPFTIYSYGLMLVIAFIVSTLLASAQARKQGIDPEVIFNLCFVVFISGIIGARIFYVLSDFKFYLAHPFEIIMLQKGGLAWFGGLILGVFSGIFYLKSKSLNVYKITDLLVPFVALAQSLGRIGCFLNGCCFGKEDQLGIYFPVHDAVLIPTQLYSSLLLIVIFIILRIMQDRPHKDGQIFFTYLLLYCAKRFFIEFWRGDSPAILFGLTLFQFISIVIFLIAATKLYLLRKS